MGWPMVLLLAQILASSAHCDASNEWIHVEFCTMFHSTSVHEVKDVSLPHHASDNGNVAFEVL